MEFNVYIETEEGNERLAVFANEGDASRYFLSLIGIVYNEIADKRDGFEGISTDSSTYGIDYASEGSKPEGYYGYFNKEVRFYDRETDATFRSVNLTESPNGEFIG